MTHTLHLSPLRLSAVAFSILLLGAAAATVHASEVTLSGAAEVPAVQTSAAGSGNITVAPDKTVSGKISTSGIAGTAAHIHIGAPGKAGPVAIPLVKSAADAWEVPEGTKLSPDQYRDYQSGKLYVNVHSAAHQNGEIRGQINP